MEKDHLSKPFLPLSLSLAYRSSSLEEAELGAARQGPACFEREARGPGNPAPCVAYSGVASRI